MDTRQNSLIKRMILALAAGSALSGCAVYAPPYATYDASYYDGAPVASTYYYPYGYSSYAYGYPAYVGPPVSLSFGFYEHSYRGGSYWGGRGWGGWRNHSGAGYRGGSVNGGSRGGWRGRR
jgi:hypothetical protein